MNLKKGIIFMLLMMLLMGGCSNTHNEKATLKSEQTMVDIKVSGKVVLYVYDLFDDYQHDQEYKNVVVSFYQSEPFMMKIKSSVASKLSKNKAYLFGLNGVVYEDVHESTTKIIDHEWVIHTHGYELKLLQEVSEKDIGALESDQLKTEVIR
ncbi:MAG: hypothetical protein KHZ15_13445 [Coprobacillus cateniformis]|nr:hypothetical protein [Coprobacillus cateniformis]